MRLDDVGCGCTMQDAAAQCRKLSAVHRRDETATVSLRMTLTLWFLTEPGYRTLGVLFDSGRMYYN